MRAILFEGPRKIRLVDDAPAPRPRDGEVLVQCKYVALCGTNMGPYTGFSITGCLLLC
jgi:threonine dehydrogenase-like Zn-dependent dehydrogenase